MPYLFGGLVLLNAITLGYHLFFHQASTTQTLEIARDNIAQPIEFTNSAAHIPPIIGTRD